MIRMRAPTIAVALIASVSCGPSAPDRGRPQEPAPLVLEQRTLTVTAGECTLVDRPCARVTVQYLEATAGGSEAARDSINTYTSHLAVSWLRDRAPESARTGSDAQTVAEAYLAEYTRFVEQFPDTVQRWSIDIAQSVLLATPKVTTVQYTIDDYSGGAHPNSLRRLVSFDVASGRPLAIDDLAGDLPRLTALAEAAFRQARGLTAEEDLAAAGFWFPDGRFALPDNLAVVADGLLFHWNPYEIAPYSMGPTELLVARAELEGLLARDPW